MPPHPIKSLFACAFGLVALPASAGLAGCNPQDQKNVTQDAKNLASSSGEALTNASLAGKVNGVLSIWKGVDMSNFHVQAQDGVITLEGHVRNPAEKKRVDSVTHQIRGVDKVIDNLTVSNDAPGK